MLSETPSGCGIGIMENDPAYGSPNKYQKIAQANNIADPDKIRAGQSITIPVLS